MKCDVLKLASSRCYGGDLAQHFPPSWGVLGRPGATQSDCSSSDGWLWKPPNTDFQTSFTIFKPTEAVCFVCCAVRGVEPNCPPPTSQEQGRLLTHCVHSFSSLFTTLTGDDKWRMCNYLTGRGDQTACWLHRNPAVMRTGKPLTDHSSAIFFTSLPAKDRNKVS